eukprot:scaffold12646_cov60-Phaeocystis_antarctica.AAC.3
MCTPVWTQRKGWPHAAAVVLEFIEWGRDEVEPIGQRRVVARDVQQVGPKLPAHVRQLLADEGRAVGPELAARAAPTLAVDVHEAAGRRPPPHLFRVYSSLTRQTDQDSPISRSWRATPHQRDIAWAAVLGDDDGARARGPACRSWPRACREDEKAAAQAPQARREGASCWR